MRAQEDHRPEARWLRGAFWRNFQVKYREINDLHKQMLRTSAKVDADAGRRRARSGRSTTSTGPVERLLLARAVRRHLHQPHAARDVRAPHRRRGPGRPGGRRSSRPPSAATSTSTGSTTSGWPARTGRHDRPDRGRRHRRLGHPGRSATPCARSCAGGPRRITRRCASTRPKRPGRATPASTRGRRRRAASIHDIVLTKEPGLADQLHYDPTSGAPGSSASCRPTPTPLAWATGTAGELGDAVDGRLRGRLGSSRAGSSPSATRRRRPRVQAAVRVDQADRHRRRPPVARRLRLEVTVENRSDPRSTRGSASSGRSTMLGGGGNPVGLVGGRRRARRRTIRAGRRRASRRSPRATTTSGSRSRSTPSEPADAWWAPVETISNSEAGFERVYQGSGLPAVSWPLALAAGRVAHGRRDPRRVTTARDRASEEAAAVDPAHRRAGRPVSRGRLVVHGHFYQPSRVDPFSGPSRPTHRPRPPATGTPGQRGVLPAERRTRQPRRTCRGTSGRRWPLAGDGDPLAYRAFVAGDRGVNGIAQPFHHAILPLASAADRRTEIRWGMRDFEVRFGRPATGMWLPETAVDLPTLRMLAEAGIRSTILAPWQVAEPYVETRRPYRVELGDGRDIVVALYDADLSAAISFEPHATADADRFARERARAAPGIRDAPR